MPVAMTAEVNYTFSPENEEWEAVANLTLYQSYPEYYECINSDCDQKALHITEAARNRDNVLVCPQCSFGIFEKEADVRKLEPTEYCATSLCEVNSALETVIIRFQREVEQANEDLRVAEEKARAKREEAEIEEEPDAQDTEQG